jgi:hypothetical protein
MATQAPPELESEYRFLREGAGVVDRRAGVIVVSGPDAVEFLQGQVTNDVDALEPGDGCYALLLNPKGRIVAEMRVLKRTPQELWLISEQNEALLSHLTTYKIGRQVDVAQRSAAIKSLIGPRVSDLVGTHMPVRECAGVEATLAGTQVLLVGTDLGVDVVHDPTRSAALDDELASRELYERVLRRPGAGGPHALQGSPEPPSARHRAARARRRRCSPLSRRQGGRRDHLVLRLAAPGADRARARAARGRTRGGAGRGRGAAPIASRRAPVRAR